MDWLDLLTVQGTLKSLLQHYSSKAEILYRSAFLIVQLSHPSSALPKAGRCTFLIFIKSVLVCSSPSPPTMYGTLFLLPFISG